MEPHHLAYTLLGIFVLIESAFSIDVKNFSMLMPDVKADRDELYLCTPVKIVDKKNYYIVGFSPHATMNRVHHMILFGCSKPGSEELFWDCGEMASENGEQKLHHSGTCAEGSHVLYAWARDAQSLKLPDDVGFQVGKNTDIHYLVLQVHYAVKLEGTDNSGINLMYTEEPQKKSAGVLLMATGGSIPSHSLTFMDSYCKIQEDKVIYPFAYRTHTHGLGKVVSGYQVVRNEDGIDDWRLLGKRNPLTPQMFYPTFTNNPIRGGDVIAARCTMQSDRDRETYIGPTNADEMCNFYLMYYVEKDTPLQMKYCVTQGPPYQSWDNSEFHFNNIPHHESSTL